MTDTMEAYVRTEKKLYTKDAIKDRNEGKLFSELSRNKLKIALLANGYKSTSRRGKLKMTLTLLLTILLILVFQVRPVKTETTAIIDATNLGNHLLMDLEPLPSGDWKHYHNYTEIVSALLFLNETYPDIVDLFSIGKSWQKRDIYCIRLTNENVAYPKPKVLFVGYHHARELISAELPFYFVVKAVTNYSIDETITRMLNYSEIYVVVALNVDGFIAVETNEWQRKNARPFDEDGDGAFDEDPPDDENGDGYVEQFFWKTQNYSQWMEGIDDDGDGVLNEDWVGGVDLNRNYGYQWNADVASGSPYPTSEVYRGPTPFSEPETQALRELALQHRFKYAISFHSGVEGIIYPWSYASNPTLHDPTFREIAGNLSMLTGAPYFQGGRDLYTASGEWGDWMYGNRSTIALTCEIYTDINAFKSQQGPHSDFWSLRGVFQYYNPAPDNIEIVIQRWLPVFTYITNRAMTHKIENTRILTTLTVEFSSATQGEPVAVKGILKDEYDNPITNVIIQFQILTWPSWKNIASANTDSNGVASISYTSSSTGEFKIRAVFDGTTKYSQTTSTTVLLNVYTRTGDYTIYYVIPAIVIITVFGEVYVVYRRRNAEAALHREEESFNNLRWNVILQILEKEQEKKRT